MPNPSPATGDAVTSSETDAADGVQLDVLVEDVSIDGMCGVY